MKNILNILSLLALFFLLITCGSKTNSREQINDNKKDNIGDFKETLEKANRYLLIQESEQIDDYIERHDLNVVQTGTGLRYYIINKGDGDLIELGDVVSIEYEIKLLNGDLIYTSKNDGVKTFLVGRGGVESGLEEAILKLRKNSEAILILPAHLAHGLLGDGNKIPARAALVYKLKVIEKVDKNN